jgi:hypothetical protein
MRKEAAVAEEDLTTQMIAGEEKVIVIVLLNTVQYKCLPSCTQIHHGKTTNSSDKIGVINHHHHGQITNRRSNRSQWAKSIRRIVAATIGRDQMVDGEREVLYIENLF